MYVGASSLHFVSGRLHLVCSMDDRGCGVDQPRGQWVGYSDIRPPHWNVLRSGCGYYGRFVNVGVCRGGNPLDRHTRMCYDLGVTTTVGVDVSQGEEIHQTPTQ